MKRSLSFIVLFLFPFLCSCNDNKDEINSKVSSKTGVTTIDVENLTYHSAVLVNKLVFPEPVATDFEYGIEYSTYKDFTEENIVRIKAQGYMDENHIYKVQIDSLDVDAQYYYRAYMINQMVIYRDEIKSFYTLRPEYKFVDLGLSVNWATFNVNAATPEEFGGYYSWGVTESSSEYGWQKYKWRESGESYENLIFSKYNNNIKYGSVDDKNTIELIDDIAHIKWGGEWRMPSEAEFDELIQNCTWKLTTQNEIKGYLVTSNKNGYTDRSIFLPASGLRIGTTLKSANSVGCYWSSSLDGKYPYLAKSLILVSDYSPYISNSDRYCGYSIRPVSLSGTWLSHISLSINEENITLIPGVDSLLHVDIKYDEKPYQADGLIKWYSDNPTVATVDNGGVVKGVSKGTAHIKANIQSLSVQCTVTVVDESELEHDCVDLGLSVNWSTLNVGAIVPEGYGAYYAWGETEVKDKYSYSNYYWCNSEDSYNNVSYTKYNTNSSYGTIDNKNYLELEDDIAHVKWGGDWRMPTLIEFYELIINCTWSWTTQNGIRGYKVTSNKPGYTDKYIFIPASGYASESYRRDLGGYGYYWSSSLCYSNSRYSNILSFDSRYGTVNSFNRTNGLSIRPVCPSESWISHISLSLDVETLTLIPGHSYNLVPIITYDNEEYKDPISILWSSSNPSVITIDESGVITAVSKGIAQITASVQSLSVQCLVTVADESEIEHEYVDLGLSVNWATSNVGTTIPEQNGYYYAWGETEVKEKYSWSSYKWCKGTVNTITKYNNLYSNITLDLEDDVANVIWGEEWRIPTSIEFDELIQNCTWAWTTQNGVNGYKVTSNKPGYTDRYIFLPASGLKTERSLYNGQYGYYWSSTLSEDGISESNYLFFNSERSAIGHIDRSHGTSVRPVIPSEAWLSHISISLERDTISMPIDDNYHLYLNIKYDGVKYDEPVTVVWTSDDESVVKVNNKGVITSISNGIAHITASIQSLSVVCTIVVDESVIKHEYVDLGLSVMWATFNVGANKPEEYGYYFAWGETEQKTDYSWINYKFRSEGDTNDNVIFTKYNTDNSHGTVDNKTTLDIEDDVAHVMWGSDWRMPTYEEQKELVDYCTWTWTTVNGVKGYRVTSRKTGYTDKSIFLPAAGCWNYTSLTEVGNYSHYWSSSLCTDGTHCAWEIDFGSKVVSMRSDDRVLRSGHSVRPVCPSKCF